MTRPSVLMVLMAAGTALAQTGTPATPICWSARPLDKCLNWVVTEAVVEAPSSSTAGIPSTSTDYKSRLAFTVGLMKNTEPMSAVGATLSVVNTDLPGRVEARFRHWFDRTTGIDVGLGLTGGHLRSHGRVQTSGVTGSVGISTTYVGADARVEYARASTGQRVHGSFVTLRTGSRATPIVSAVAGLGILILAASLGFGP